MTATNHALTGALIGLTLTDPLLALPLAFASHFVLDAIPHYGGSADHLGWMRSRLFRALLMFDALFCVALVLLLFVRRPVNWFVAALCAFAATSPDLFWIKKFICAVKRKKLLPDTNLFLKFHDHIQWFQRPIGVVVEVCWLACALVLLLPFLR